MSQSELPEPNEPEEEDEDERLIGVSPYDGFRVTIDAKRDPDTLQQLGEAVLLEFRADEGKTAGYVELCHHPIGPVGKARQRQIVNVLEAVAHYLNTGGDLDELQQALRAAQPLCDEFSIGLAEPWYLLDWVYDVIENKYVFANDVVGDVLVVCPEAYAEQVSMTDFNNQTPDDDDDEDEEG